MMQLVSHGLYHWYSICHLLVGLFYTTVLHQNNGTPSTTSQHLCYNMLYTHKQQILPAVCHVYGTSSGAEPMPSAVNVRFIIQPSCHSKSDIQAIGGNSIMWTCTHLKQNPIRCHGLNHSLSLDFCCRLWRFDNFSVRTMARIPIEHRLQWRWDHMVQWVVIAAGLLIKAPWFDHFRHNTRVLQCIIHISQSSPLVGEKPSQLLKRGRGGWWPSVKQA